MDALTLTGPLPSTRQWPRRLATTALVVFGAIVTAAATIAGGGNPVIAVAPVVLAVAVYALWTAPVRYPLMALIFLCLSVDAIEEGPWSSPLAPIGTLLANNLNRSIPIGALVIPGTAVAMLGLLALVAHRRLIGARTDMEGRGPTVPVVLGALLTSLVAALGLVVLGAVRGGDTQMAKIQIQNFVQMLLMAYLVSMSFRDLRDYRMLGRIIVFAAVLRSFYVMWVVIHVFAGRNGELNVAATHGDSLLFAGAAVLLIVRFLEKPNLRYGLWCVFLMPILLIAMDWNNRRLVWVQFAVGLLIALIISRRSAMKRLLGQLALAMLPLIAVYIGAGWNSQSRIFAPIKMFRSVSDGQVNSSTLYRDLENYNLMITMRVSPLTGLGFGHQFAEIVTLPDISFFKEYRYMPHNSILGLWAFTGPVGFAGIWITVVVTVFMASRSYRFARTAEERTAAAMVLSIIVIYLAQCWGDIGFSERRTIVLVGPAIALAGQLAFATGAWRASSKPQT